MSIKARLDMIKELFNNKKKKKLDYYEQLKHDTFRLRNRLIEIDRKYDTPEHIHIHGSEGDCPKMPRHIQRERKKIEAKLSIYNRAIEREYDRSYVSWRLFWYWLIG